MSLTEWGEKYRRVRKEEVFYFEELRLPLFCYSIYRARHKCACGRARIRVLYIDNKIQKVFLYYIEILDKERVYSLHGRARL